MAGATQGGVIGTPGADSLQRGPLARVIVEAPIARGLRQATQTVAARLGHAQKRQVAGGDSCGRGELAAVIAGGVAERLDQPCDMPTCCRYRDLLPEDRAHPGLEGRPHAGQAQALDKRERGRKRLTKLRLDECRIGVQVEHAADVTYHRQERTEIVERQRNAKAMSLGHVHGREMAACRAPLDMAPVAVLVAPFQPVDTPGGKKVSQPFPGVRRAIGQHQRDVLARCSRRAAQRARCLAHMAAEGVVEASQAGEAAGMGDIGNRQRGRDRGKNVIDVIPGAVRSNIITTNTPIIHLFL